MCHFFTLVRLLQCRDPKFGCQAISSPLLRESPTSTATRLAALGGPSPSFSGWRPSQPLPCWVPPQATSQLSDSGQVEMSPLSVWPPGVRGAPVLPQLLGAGAEMLRCPECLFCNCAPGGPGSTQATGRRRGAPAYPHPWAPLQAAGGLRPPQSSGKMPSRGMLCSLDDFDLQSEFCGLVLLGFSGAGEVCAQPGGASGPRDWGLGRAL